MMTFLVYLALGLGLGLLAARAPMVFFTVAVIIVIAVSCERANADPLRLELSVITESSDDRASAQAAIDSANAIYTAQLGIEIVPTYWDINTVSNDTAAGFLLDAVSNYRIDHTQHRTADATVLFTRRSLSIGSEAYDGIATIGPACSAASDAVVELHDDGLDGQVLAHELAHTLGVMHDSIAGYLMSVAVARTSSPNFSPDSILSVKAAALDCLQSPLPIPMQQSGVGAPHPATGGGGAFDICSILVLTLLVVVVEVLRRESAAIRKARAQALTIAELRLELSQRGVPNESLDAVRGAWATPADDPRHDLMIAFTTHASMLRMQRWLLERKTQA